MANIGTAYVQIVPSMQGVTANVTKALNTGGLDKAGTSAGKRVGREMSKGMKLALAAGVAGAGAIVKKGIEAYADNQQLVGGIETLFKDNADTMKKYADEAYSAAGLSANQYMDTVTSFSASLLASLGGDTKKAAEVANSAVIAMADNANKMGSSMESIQNAYQGFAKQNYTMLDNLKLGYGGTKEEMQRLLEDAEKLSGKKFDISSYADIIEAIQVIQDKMGITGTTAEEAATTISGSIAALKASWENLLVVVFNSGLTDKIANVATFLTEKVIPAIEANPDLLKKVAVGIGAVVTAITVFNAVQAVKTAMEAAEVTTLGALAVAEATALAPILLITAGILAAIAAGYLIIKNWDKIKAKAIELAGKVKTAFSNLKDKITAPFISASEKIKSIIDRIKGFFPIKIGNILSNIKLPHFSLSGEFSLKKRTVPKLSVNWYKTGGVFDGPSVIGVGEAGPEAVVPLDKFWKKLDNAGGTVINFNGNYSFMSRAEIDYFMKQSERLTRRGVALG